jgi:hypothetical protein
MASFWRSLLVVECCLLVSSFSGMEERQVFILIPALDLVC